MCLGEFAEDLPVCLCLAGRVLGLSPLLDTAFGRGLGAVLLGKTGCREDNIGELGGLGHEDILHDHELDVLQSLLHVVEVRVGEHRVLTHDIDALDLAGLVGKGIDQRGDRQADFALGNLAAPCSPPSSSSSRGR